MRLELDDDLAEALRRLAQQHQSIELELAARLVDLAIRRSHYDLRLRWESLSERQQQVALLLRAGFSDRQVAAQLHITRDTVRTHLERVLLRMGVRSRVELRALMRMAEMEDESIRSDTQVTPPGASRS